MGGDQKRWDELAAMALGIAIWRSGLERDRPSREEAEAIAQDVVIALFLKSMIEVVENPNAWIYRAVEYKLSERRRDPGRKRRKDLADPDGGDGLDRLESKALTPEDDAAYEELIAAFAMLDPEDRMLLKFDLEG